MLLNNNIGEQLSDSTKDFNHAEAGYTDLKHHFHIIDTGHIGSRLRNRFNGGELDVSYE